MQRAIQGPGNLWLPGAAEASVPGPGAGARETAESDIQPEQGLAAAVLDPKSFMTSTSGLRSPTQLGIPLKWVLGRGPWGSPFPLKAEPWFVSLPQGIPTPFLSFLHAERPRPCPPSPRVIPTAISPIPRGGSGGPPGLGVGITV